MFGGSSVESQGERQPLLLPPKRGQERPPRWKNTLATPFLPKNQQIITYLSSDAAYQILTATRETGWLLCQPQVMITNKQTNKRTPLRPRPSALCVWLHLGDRWRERQGEDVLSLRDGRNRTGGLGGKLLLSPPGNKWSLSQFGDQPPALVNRSKNYLGMFFHAFLENLGHFLGTI